MKPTDYFRRSFGAALSFLLPVLFFLAFSLRDGVLTELGPDAELYLSVADNFLSTGHFIQTVRETPGFVVPFGLPLILTLFRALRLNVDAIVVIQHFLTGLSCLFLYFAERNHFGRGGFAPMVFTVALLRAEVTPDNIYLEIYYLFFLCAILWLLSEEEMPLKKRLLWLNVLAFCAYSIRTVLMLVWLPILVWTVVSVAQKRFPVRRALALAAGFALVLLLNTAVNHRETGCWILTDNYSGESLYIAANPHTIPDWYSSRELDRFVGEEYYAIRDDASLNQTQENALFTAKAREWTASNPGTFIKNTAEKFVKLFLRYWFFAPALALCGFVSSLRGADKARKRRLTCELCVNIALAAATSCALIMGRYSLPIWPLTALHLAALAHTALQWLIMFGGKKRHAA